MINLKRMRPGGVYLLSSNREKRRLLVGAWDAPRQALVGPRRWGVDGHRALDSEFHAQATGPAYPVRRILTRLPQGVLPIEGMIQDGRWVVNTDLYEFLIRIQGRIERRRNAAARILHSLKFFRYGGAALLMIVIDAVGQFFAFIGEKLYDFVIDREGWADAFDEWNDKRKELRG